MDVTTEAVSDETLVARCREGDADSVREAFQALYERHAGPLLGYLSRRGGCEHTAEDLVQNTFLKIHAGLDRFDGRSSFRTWLYTVARNLLVDHVRKVGRMRQVSPDMLEERPSGTDPAAAAVEADEVQRVHRALAALPEDQREAVSLVRLGGMKYAEAAAVLGISLDALRMRVHRGHLELVQSLGAVTTAPQAKE